MLDSLLQVTREKMQKASEITHTDLSSIHSGRATPALVENIQIIAYGGSQRLRLMEMATITTLDHRTLVISLYDPSVILEVNKCIQEANIGLTPLIDGEVIRITIPPLSAERRQEYIKLAHAKLEAGRVMVRQVRQESMKDLRRLEADKQISEDERLVGERKIQELTDELIAELDGLGRRKEAELLQV